MFVITSMFIWASTSHSYFMIYIVTSMHKFDGYLVIIVELDFMNIDDSKTFGMSLSCFLRNDINIHNVQPGVYY